jgi:hypothetical protein
MRVLQVTCDYCGHQESMPPDRWNRTGWDKHKGLDACPGCMWDVECGQAPQLAPHPTVRPLPARTVTQRPPRDAA